MKRNGTFKHLLATMAGVFSAGGEWTPPPARNFTLPYTPPQHTKARTIGAPKKRLRYPRCTPGTIAYHDRLVRRFGRREADKMGARIRAGNWSAPEWLEDKS